MSKGGSGASYVAFWVSTPTSERYSSVIHPKTRRLASAWRSPPAVGCSDAHCRGGTGCLSALDEDSKTQEELHAITDEIFVCHACDYRLCVPCARRHVCDYYHPADVPGLLVHAHPLEALYRQKHLHCRSPPAVLSLSLSRSARSAPPPGPSLGSYSQLNPHLQPSRAGSSPRMLALAGF